MKLPFEISVAALSSLLWFGISSPAQTPAEAAATPSQPSSVSAAEASAPAGGYSKVRIVRLSQVKGEVQLDRNIGRGLEAAMANLPITEGDVLKTGNGVAEVEFEDNSTLRLAQNSTVQFPRLELMPSGGKISAVQVVQGTVYVSLMKTKGNEFTLSVGRQTLNLPADSHVRVQLTGEQAQVAVMHGDAEVSSPDGSTTVAKNKTATLNVAGEDEPVVAEKVAKQPLDSWDHDAVQYHNSFANASSYGNVPYAYGVNDLNYYGSFVDAGSCGGSLWRPYFASANWDPYGSGVWAYYANAGYSWVSPYPWAWTPYHYGSWDFCPGLGWGWRPGGTWMGLANNSFTSAPGRPRPPLKAPITAASSLMAVNLKAIPVSNLDTHNNFVFRNNSAGFGVPRGSLGRLNDFSGDAVRHGAAETNVYFSGQHGGYEGQMRAASPMHSESMENAGAAGRSYSAPMGGSAGGMSHAAPASSGGSGGRH